MTVILGWKNNDSLKDMQEVYESSVVEKLYGYVLKEIHCALEREMVKKEWQNQVLNWIVLYLQRILADLLISHQRQMGRLTHGTQRVKR